MTHSFQLRDKVRARGITGIISGIVLDGKKDEGVAYIMRSGDAHLMCSESELELIE